MRSRSTRRRRRPDGPLACCATWSASGSSSPPARRPATASTVRAELQRLRTLRELLAEHDIGLSDIAFARRLREEAGLRRDTEAWLEAEAERPDEVPAADWLRFEQEKHQRLLAAVAATN